MPKLINLIGKRFGKLVVLSFNKQIRRASFWLCICDCGIQKVIRGASLTRSYPPGTKSCGCLNHRKGKESSCYKHGMIKTRTYISWASMLNRCLFVNKGWHYENYILRGIIVCKRWRNFINFFKDMGERPPKTTLERKNNNKGYYKKNCYWATAKQQARNRRTSRYLTLNGKTHCMAEWAEITKIDENTIFMRLKYGWSIEETLTIPVKK